jgi:hypothetical protein
VGKGAGMRGTAGREGHAMGDDQAALTERKTLLERGTRAQGWWVGGVDMVGDMGDGGNDKAVLMEGMALKGAHGPRGGSGVSTLWGHGMGNDKATLTEGIALKGVHGPQGWVGGVDIVGTREGGRQSRLNGRNGLERAGHTAGPRAALGPSASLTGGGVSANWSK